MTSGTGGGGTAEELAGCGLVGCGLAGGGRLCGGLCRLRRRPRAKGLILCGLAGWTARIKHERTTPKCRQDGANVQPRVAGGRGRRLGRCRLCRRRAVRAGGAGGARPGRNVDQAVRKGADEPADLCGRELCHLFAQAFVSLLEKKLPGAGSHCGAGGQASKGKQGVAK